MAFCPDTGSDSVPVFGGRMPCKSLRSSRWPWSLRQQRLTTAGRPDVAGPYHRAPTSKSRRRRRPAQIRRGWSVSVLDGQPATPADDDANCCPIVINFPATNCCRPRPAQHRDQSSLRNRATLYIPFNSTNEIVFSRVSVCLSVCLLTGLLKNCWTNLCEILWDGWT